MTKDSMFATGLCCTAHLSERALHQHNKVTYIRETQQYTNILTIARHRLRLLRLGLGCLALNLRSAIKRSLAARTKEISWWRSIEA